MSDNATPGALGSTEGLGLEPERATMRLTLADLVVLAATAERNGTQHAFQAVALQWCGQAQAEIERLRMDLENTRAEARLAVAAERQRLGPPPERTAVDRLMKRCQIGVGPRQMGEAHDIMAECYGTLGRQQIEIEQLRAALLDARDCRTCRNFTTRSGGCVSVLRCVDGSGYKRQGRFQYWESAPPEA